MGKISDALEKYKREKSIKPADYLINTAEKFVRSESGSPVCDFFDSQKYSPKLVTLSVPDSVDAESFKTLRTQILFAKDRDRPRALMVTSTFPGEGKTFVAANLAVSIAMGIDEYVLLIDGDLRRPRLHEMLGYTNCDGLHEYLTGKNQLPDLIIRTEIEKLSILPAGRMPPNPTELLSSTRMKEFLEEVRERYQDRFIIVDSTPMQFTAEASILANYVDGVILVIMAQKSPRKAIQEAIKSLGKDKVLGLVFNGYSKAYDHYGRYYSKYYRRGYQGE